jgi:TPR repeat protein
LDAKKAQEMAAKGSTQAMLELGLLYHDGEGGMPRDLAAFEKWSRKAAELGDADAQYSLGTYYQYGFFGPMDSASAAPWYLKSAKQGNAYAANALGRLHMEGNGVPQSDAEAYFWFSVAIGEGNNAEAGMRTSMSIKLGPKKTADIDRKVKQWKAAPARPPDTSYKRHYLGIIY